MKYIINIPDESRIRLLVVESVELMTKRMTCD